MTNNEPLKRLPVFDSDEEAAAFVASADLSEYDLSGATEFAAFAEKHGLPVKA